MTVKYCPVCDEYIDNVEWETCLFGHKLTLVAEHQHEKQLKQLVDTPTQTLVDMKKTIENILQERQNTLKEKVEIGQIKIQDIPKEEVQKLISELEPFFMCKEAHVTIPTTWTVSFDWIDFNENGEIMAETVGVDCDRPQINENEEYINYIVSEMKKVLRQIMSIKIFMKRWKLTKAQVREIIFKEINLFPTSWNKLLEYEIEELREILSRSINRFANKGKSEE